MKNNKRKFIVLFLIFVMVFALAVTMTSCEKTDESILKKDLKGRTSQRIVCLAPNMVEVVYALGLGDEIVGWSAYTDYPVDVTKKEGWQPYAYYYDTDAADFNVEEELSREVAVVSKFYDCNYEIVEKLEPTVILGYGTEQEYMIEDFKGMGFENSYNYNCLSLDDAYDMMISVGEILGVPNYAKALVDGYNKELAEIKAITDTLTDVPVYFEIAHQMDYGEFGVYGPYTECAGTPFSDMIDIAGGVNVFNDIEGSYMEISFQDIVDRNPEVIFTPYWPDAYDFEVTTTYEIMTRPGFDQIDAVKHGRVYFYDSSLMKRFGPRTVTAIKKLAYLLHPYYFENPEKSVSPWELGKIDIFEDFPEPLE